MTSPLIITEIYASVQGESSYAGIPCVFVRFTGCPLRCRWCDTTYSFEGGKSLSLEEVLEQIKSYGIPLVELTGGEPLASPRAVDLCKALLQQNYQVLIETGGSEPVKEVPPRVHLIMDIKCPGSRMHERNLWDNLNYLKPTDEIKFVLSNREDYDWAKDIMLKHNLTGRFKVLLSPAFGLLKPMDLAAWMVEDKLSVRLNLQQHKYIWHPRQKGV